MTGDRIPEGPVRDLLAAVLEAIDIPFPATAGDAENYRRLIEDRALHTRVTLRAVLRESSFLDIAGETAYLRGKLAELPPTDYEHYRPAGGGER